MPVKKVYYCCICHKILDYKPHRLVYQEWEEKGYGLYKNQNNFDFCNNCFKTFIVWIEENKKVKK